MGRPQSISRPVTVESLAALQRTAGNRAVTSTVQRTDGEVGAAEREAVMESVLRLERALSDFAAAERRWLAANWIEFYGYASSNPRISWSRAITDAVLGEAFGNLTADAAQGWLAQRAAGTGAGAAVAARLGGRAVGFVLAVLIETAAGLVYNAVRNTTSEDEAGAGASARTAGLIGDQVASLDAREQQALVEVRARADELRGQVGAATDPAVLTALHTSITTEAARVPTALQPADRSLLEALLRDWVREHAGDRDDAATGTSEEQWTRAQARAFGEAGLAGHSEVFAYQTRGVATELGLDATEPQAWIADVTGGPQVPAEVHRGYNGRTVTWSSTTNPQALAEFLRRNNGGRALSATGMRVLTANDFRLTCRLDLEEDSGAVYVDEWQYTFELLTDEWWLWERSPGSDLPRPPAQQLGREIREAIDANAESIDFAVSPD